MTNWTTSGMLLRHGNTFGIYYATHIPNEGFQRFSVGHELGHYFLDGHIDHILPKDGIHVSHAGFVSADTFELEADHFSAGLLMPSTPFKKSARQTKSRTGNRRVHGRAVPHLAHGDRHPLR
jgi:Zn-dependent peptidase ImmA (M78 family)